MFRQTHLPSSVCCNMSKEHRSSAHPVRKPFSQSSIKHQLVIVIFTLFFIVFFFSLLPAIVLISIFSIYALYAMHLIVKEIVLENIEINQIGRGIFKRDRQLHAKQVNCTYHIREIQRILHDRAGNTNFIIACWWYFSRASAAQIQFVSSSCHIMFCLL